MGERSGLLYPGWGEAFVLVLLAWWGQWLLRDAFRVPCPVCRKGNMVDLSSERGALLLLRKERRAGIS